MSQQRGLRPLDPIFDPGKRLGAIAVGNSPGAVTGGGHPMFCHDETVTGLSTSPAWPVEFSTTYTECIVTFRVVDQIEFDINVNGATADSVVCSTGSPQTFAVSVPVVRDDEVTIEITDFDGGAAEGVVIALRYAL